MLISSSMIKKKVKRTAQFAYNRLLLCPWTTFVTKFCNMNHQTNTISMGQKWVNWPFWKKLATSFLNIFLHFSLVMLSKSPCGGTLQETSQHDFLPDDLFWNWDKNGWNVWFRHQGLPNDIPRRWYIYGNIVLKATFFCPNVGNLSQKASKLLRLRGTCVKFMK